MDQNLDFLADARENYSQLMIEIGSQYLKIFPQANPEEFLETFMPPHNDILMILKREKARIKKKKRLRELKLHRELNKILGRFKGGQL